MLTWGDSSFYILTFYFLMFKPASLFKIHLYGLNPKMIGCHPIIFPTDDNWYWIIYSLSSIVLCVIIAQLLLYLKEKRLFLMTK